MAISNKFLPLLFTVVIAASVVAGTVSGCASEVSIVQKIEQNSERTLPLIDTMVPETVETATFALG